jgi:hypothetical protein
MRAQCLFVLISDLLPQLEILASQLGDFLSQLGNFAPKLPYQLGQLGRHRGRMWANKQSSMTTTLVNEARPQGKDRLPRGNGFGEVLQSKG